MKTVFEEIGISTKKEFELVDVTERVSAIVDKSGIRNGMVLVYSPHTTGLVRISESEPGLLEDYKDAFDNMIPRSLNYRHNKTNVDSRPNAHSHLRSMLVNSSEAIPLRNGKMMLGMWQTIFFVEFDGARPGRKLTVEVMGE